LRGLLEVEAGPNHVAGDDASVPGDDGSTGGRDAASSLDSTTPDDGSSGESGTPDGEGPETGAPEAGAPDAGPDSGTPDAGGADAEPADSGPACLGTTTGATVYVNQARGSDDPFHGGGQSACAFKTISYALKFATATINVAAGTFTAAKGETLPLVLTGAQSLVCGSATTTTTIMGQGPYMTTHASVVMTGTSNGLNNCDITGNSLAGACILIASNGTGAGHTVKAVAGNNCGSAAVIVQGSNAHIADSNFYDNDRGIAWTAASSAATGPSGDMTNNVFAHSAVMNGDITCAAPYPNVTGSNNTDGKGDAFCSGCDRCPFK
jgi:hypothetical protein